MRATLATLNSTEKANRGRYMPKRLTPEARMAVISLSLDKRPTAISAANRKAIGMTSTSMLGR